MQKSCGFVLAGEDAALLRTETPKVLLQSVTQNSPSISSHYDISKRKTKYMNWHREIKQALCTVMVLHTETSKEFETNEPFSRTDALKSEFRRLKKEGHKLELSLGTWVRPCLKVQTSKGLHEGQ